MPDQLTADGLTVKSVTEIVSDLTTALQSIYGSDINVDQNSPDGQLVNIFAQSGADQREILLSVYNSFSVEAAFGVLLDQRVALNGLARHAGTFTLTNVTVTISGNLNLVGLDTTDPLAAVFTVADGAGVQYQLISSVSLTGAGDHVLAFQAALVGITEPVINTITNIVTIVQGVTGVNNPSAATSIGTPEESDADLRIRHDKSFSLASTGPADSIEAALLATANVTDAFVAENDTGSTSGGVTAHSIWCIVEGGTNADIGQVIYSKKAPGCGMVGGVSVVINRPNGTTFTALFDRPIDEDLYIQLTITPKKSGISFDAAAIKAEIVANLFYKLNQRATTGDVILLMAALQPNAILSVVNVSDDGFTWVEILNTTDFQHKFVLDVSRITVTLV